MHRVPRHPAPLVVLVLRDPQRASALAEAVARGGAEAVVARTRGGAITAVRDGRREVCVVADLHLDVPNAGLELLLHLRDAYPTARAYLLGAKGRFAPDVPTEWHLDADACPASFVSHLLGGASVERELA